jgi:hypothetical protein
MTHATRLQESRNIYGMKMWLLIAHVNDRRVVRKGRSLRILQSGAHATVNTIWTAPEELRKICIGKHNLACELYKRRDRKQKNK